MMITSETPIASRSRNFSLLNSVEDLKVTEAYTWAGSNFILLQNAGKM
jgi:hypothetical protein